MIREIFHEHARVVSESEAALVAALEEAGRLAATCLRAGGTILVAGNGGSAADAQHFAAELVGRFEDDRPALPAIALTVNSSSLTAIANDFGFDQIFTRQLQALARPGDLLIAISTSGTSANILNAVREARKRGCRVMGLTGAGGDSLARMSDIALQVPSRSVARIQEIHELCLHALAAYLEATLKNHFTGGEDR